MAMIFIVLVSLLGQALCQEVEIPQGKIKGTTLTTRGGKDYLAFLGIPYAKPPLNNLRFKNPELLEKWDKEIDGTKSPSPCLQVLLHKKRGTRETTGVEDCLVLNIFTPKLKPDKHYPVVIYIHGGGFRIGQMPGKYEAGYVMDEEVVFVTLQYRLGALGFLSTEDDQIPGNFGLKDQSLAIHWVHKYIKNFGGDPDKITIYGISAGGISVHYQTISPLNKGIIKASIADSGVANEFWGLGKPGTSKAKAQKVADLTKCEYKELLKCLQGKPAQEVQLTEVDFVYNDIEPLVVFKPVVEQKNPNAFMTENPLKTKITTPFMTGFATDEGLLKIGSLAGRDKSETDYILNDLESNLKKMLYTEESPDLDESVKLIISKYFKGTREEKIDGLKEFYSYINFITPVYKLLENQGDLYLFVFNYKPAHSYVDIFSNGHSFTGVGHGDSNILLLNTTSYLPKKNPDEDEASKNLIKLWTNFAKYGKPTLDEPQWLPSNKGDYMEITKERQPKKDYNKEELKFWMNLPIIKNQKN